MSEDELKEASSDVVYEFKMFRKAWKRLSSCRVGVANPAQSGRAMTLASSLPASNNTQFSQPSTTLGHNDSARSISLEGLPIATPANHGFDFLDVEALLIHYRVLLEFFYSAGKAGDTLLADDYLCGAARPGRPDWYDYDRKRLNKLLVHLTRRRTGYRRNNEHHWQDIEKKAEYIDNEINRFLSLLPMERKDWFA